MNVIIVGGGWSGLAAAVLLTRKGHQVTLFEAAGQLGGRARSVPWQDITVDNGQHLMVGAYRHMLQLFQWLGIDTRQVFDHMAFNLRVIDSDFPELRLNPDHRWLPASLQLVWQLYRTGGQEFLLAMLRFRLSVKKFCKNDTATVDDWCQQTRQPHRLIRQLWEPLCLAILNTPLNEASAKVFANVLQDSLFAGNKARQCLIPRLPLGQLLPEPASKFIRNNGGQIHLNQRIKRLQFSASHISGVIDDQDDYYPADAVILALPAAALKNFDAPFPNLPAVKEYPISTIYLRYKVRLVLPEKMLAFSGALCQWLFDHNEQTPGLVAVVISGPGSHTKLSKTELAEKVCSELHHLLPNWPAKAETTYIIREKRATFACTPEINQQRPARKTAISGLWLAGDFVQHNYPATLETAVINGFLAAEDLIKFDVDHVTAR